MNSINHGSIQKREKVFALSVLDNLKIPFSNDEEYKNKLEEKSKLYEKKWPQNIFETIFRSSSQDEIDDSLINKTPSRIRMIKTAKNLNTNISKKIFNSLKHNQNLRLCFL